MMMQESATGSFTKALLLPPEPEHGLFWAYDDPALSGCITFLADMNTAIKPPPAAFSFIVDGVPKTPDSLAWLNDRVLQVRYSEAVLGPSVVNLDFPAPHPQLRFAAGPQVGSFFSLGFEFVPSASGEYDTPDLEITILFPTIMDTSVIPLISDFLIDIDDSEEIMDSIEWVGNTRLLFKLSKAGLNVINNSLEYPVPSDRLRAVDLHQACPFSILDLQIEDVS